MRFKRLQLLQSLFYLYYTLTQTNNGKNNHVEVVRKLFS